jgi:hypothetical protein
MMALADVGGKRSLDRGAFMPIQSVRSVWAVAAPMLIASRADLIRTSCIPSNSRVLCDTVNMTDHGVRIDTADDAVVCRPENVAIRTLKILTDALGVSMVERSEGCKGTRQDYGRGPGSVLGDALFETPDKSASAALKGPEIPCFGPDFASRLPPVLPPATHRLRPPFRLVKSAQGLTEVLPSAQR